MLGVPAVGVCTLDTLAAAQAELVEAGRPYVVATDARRREVHWARYEGHRRVQGPAVDRPATVAERLGDAPVVGRGAQMYADVLYPVAGPADPSAAVLAQARLDETVELLPPEPIYLRRPDVSALGPRKSVLSSR